MSSHMIEEDIEFRQLEQEILAGAPSRRELFLYWSAAILFCVLAWYGVISGIIAIWEHFSA